MIIEFRNLLLQHCQLLHQWLQLHHVREFWDDVDRELEQVVNHYIKTDETSRYLFYMNSIAVGYIQIYDINSTHQYAKLANLTSECCGIDFFIGNPNYLGSGLSYQIITQFIASYSQNKPTIVDPLINNHKAIHIYEKVGFSTIKKFIDNGNHHLLMIKL